MDNMKSIQYNDMSTQHNQLVMKDGIGNNSNNNRARTSSSSSFDLNTKEKNLMWDERRKILIQEAVRATESLQTDGRNTNNNNNNNNNNNRRRPDQISITFHRNEVNYDYSLPLIAKQNIISTCGNNNNNNNNNNENRCSTGVEFQYNKEDEEEKKGGSTIIDSNTNIETQLHQCLLKFIQTGDELISINDYNCHDKYLGEIHHYWYEVTGRITIIISTKTSLIDKELFQYNNKNDGECPLQLRQTIVLHQPTMSSYFLSTSSNHDDDNINTNELYDDDDDDDASSTGSSTSTPTATTSNEYNDDSIEENCNSNIGITFSHRDGYLCIKHISSKSNFWFIPPKRKTSVITTTTTNDKTNTSINNNNNTPESSSSCTEEGGGGGLHHDHHDNAQQTLKEIKQEAIIDRYDLVTNINNISCIQNLTINDIQLLTETALMKDNYLSITTIIAHRKYKRWNKIRKNAVAVGGGTLMGIGTIVMATPLHPIGHALTLSGLSVLSTEFDGPKRMVNKLFRKNKKK